MPIHLDDIDVVPELEGVRSALIVPCNLCPAVTVAIRENKAFMQPFRSLTKSAPFERYIRALQSRLSDRGIKTKVFRSTLYHHWFLCMWTSARRRKLRKHAKRYDAVIVLGCDSATETVREAVKSTNCKVIEAMTVVGLTNAKLRFHLPCSLSFDDARLIPIPRQKDEEGAHS